MSWEWEGSVILIMSQTFSWPQRRLQMTGKGQDFIHRNRTPKENASLTFHVRDSLTFRVWSILRTASAAGKGVGCPTSYTMQRHFTRQNQHEQHTGRCFAAQRPFNRTLARPLPPEEVTCSHHSLTKCVTPLEHLTGQERANALTAALLNS